jgi:ribose 5-phosphate isomerase B
MRIAIASDHAATELKAELVTWLTSEGHQVADLGPSSGARVDYPDFGYKLAEYVAVGRAERGIALCGSGIGISIAVNRNPACRCALVNEPVSARLSREHNDANVVALGARLIGVDMAKAGLTSRFARQRTLGRTYREPPAGPAALPSARTSSVPGDECSGCSHDYSHQRGDHEPGITRAPHTAGAGGG